VYNYKILNDSKVKSPTLSKRWVHIFLWYA